MKIVLLLILVAVCVESHPLEDNGVQCPDNKTECPVDNSCCPTDPLHKYWDCCPITNADCCDDYIHCCPATKKCMPDGDCLKLNKYNRL